MQDPAAPGRAIRFGSFELDVRSGELHKGPSRLKVPDQSIEILRALLEQPGELVTRERLRERLWPSDTFVDFEHGLNAAVRHTTYPASSRPVRIDRLPWRSGIKRRPARYLIGRSGGHHHTNRVRDCASRPDGHRRAACRSWTRVDSRSSSVYLAGRAASSTQRR